MITGDRKETAISIAREVGLLPETGNLGGIYFSLFFLENLFVHFFHRGRI